MRGGQDTSAPGWPLIFLAGPVIWYVYFWVVYLLAEAGCSPGFAELAILGPKFVTVMTLTATSLALTLIVYLTAKAYGQMGRPLLSSSDNEANWFHLLAAMLGVWFLVATMFVGLPALYLDVC